MLTPSFSSVLTQNFRAGRALSSTSGQLLAFRNVHGEPELYLVGDEGEVRHVFADTNSNSGWGSARTGLTGATQIAGAVGPEGRPIVFAIVGNAVQFAERAGFDPGSAWTSSTLSLPTVVSTPVQIFFNPSEPGSDRLWHVSIAAQTILPNQGILTTTQWLGGSSAASGFANLPILSSTSYQAASAGGVFTVVAQSFGTAWDLYSVAGGQVQAVSASIPQSFDVASFAVEDNPGGPVPYIAVVDTSGAVHALSPTQLAWQQLAAPLAAGVQFSQPQLVLDTRYDLLHLFVLGADADGNKKLYHAVRSVADVTSSWSDLVILSADVSGYSAVIDVANNLHVFTTGAESGKLDLLSQRFEQEDWTVQSIRLPDQTQLIDNFTYATEMTLTDESGAAVAGVRAWVGANQPLVAIVNGATVVLDQDEPFETTTDASGRVTVTAEVDDLSTALIKLKFEGQPFTDPYVVVANDAIKGRLAGVTQADLDGAVDQATQTKIFGPDVNTKDVADAVSSFAQLQLSPAERRAPQRQTRYTNPAVFHAEDEAVTRIPATRLAGQRWIVDFAPDSPNIEFRRVSEAELAERLQPMGFLQKLETSWSDFWQNVRHDTAQIKCIILADAEATIHLIKDTVELVYRAELRFIEQVFDPIQQIFRHVGAEISKVFGWLAAFFDWQDILRSQRAIAHGMRQLFELIHKGADPVARWIDKGVTWFSSRVTAAAQKLEQQLLDSSFQGLSDEQRASPITAADATNNNIALNNLLTPQPGEISSDESAAPRIQGLGLRTRSGRPLDDAWKEFLAKVESTVAKFGEGALQKVVSDVQSTFASPGNILAKGAASVIAILADVLELLIRLGGELIVELLDFASKEVVDAVLATLDAPIQIPILTSLFERITRSNGQPGEALTILNLIALAVGMVVTPAYKIITLGTAGPFPDQASLDAFERFWTADAMLQWLGLTPPAEGRGPAWPDPKTLEVFLIVGAVVSGFAGFIQAVMVPMTDIMMAVGGVDNLEGKLEWVGDILDQLGSLAPKIMLTAVACNLFSAIPLVFLKNGMDDLQATRATDWGLGVFSWFLSVLYLKQEKKIVRTLPGLQGTGLTAMFGVASLSVNIVAISNGFPAGKMSGVEVAMRVIRPLPDTLVFLRNVFAEQPEALLVYALVVDTFFIVAATTLNVLNTVKALPQGAEPVLVPQEALA